MRGAANTAAPRIAAGAHWTAARRRQIGVPCRRRRISRRAARTTASIPAPAKSARKGYAVIQCLVPPKMGVLGESHIA